MPNLDNPIETIKGSRKTLFILCGLPYSGKTFVAQKILEATPVAYVSVDDIFHAHGFDWNTNTLPNGDEWQKIFDESYEISKTVLQDGKNILYDSTNQTLVSREKLREVARSVGARTMVIYIQCPPEIVWKRWEKNVAERDRTSVSKDLVQMTIDQFEVPTEDENTIAIIND